MNLYDIEKQGYRLGVEAGRLAFNSPQELLTENRLQTLREHKQELIDQVLLRNFCKLVIHYGIDRNVLLTEERISRELDDADIECLRHNETWEKQQWAEMLADRLTRGWTLADQLPDDAVLH